MIEFLTAVTRGLAVLGVLLAAAVWHWTPSRGQSRGNTFFGAHVETGFAESRKGAAILYEFRVRLWLCAVAVAVSSMLVPLHFAVIAGPIFSSLTGLAAFALAHRRTQRDAVRFAEPTLRVASAVAEDETDAVWLGVLDWLVIIVPLVLPTVTLTFLVLYWNQLPTNGRATPLVFVLFGWILCFMCASNQWALRFRARSSDWASTPSASHKYRTYLGVLQAAVFTFITWQICALTLIVIPLNGTLPSPRHLHMPTYFMVSFPAETLLVVLVWRMRFWLKRHLAAESSDPMSDTCWRWGYFYFNQCDPALVVPLRTGVGQSFNYARPSVWVVGMAVTVMTAATFICISLAPLHIH
jgi:uncharacterized membrane protein